MGAWLSARLNDSGSQTQGRHHNDATVSITEKLNACDNRREADKARYLSLLFRCRSTVTLFFVKSLALVENLSGTKRNFVYTFPCPTTLSCQVRAVQLSGRAVLNGDPETRTHMGNDVQYRASIQRSLGPPYRISSVTWDILRVATALGYDSLSTYPIRRRPSLWEKMHLCQKKEKKSHSVVSSCRKTSKC